MFDLTRHPRLLRLLSIWDRVKSVLRGRSGDGGLAEKNLQAFYDRAWREAAARLGGTVESLGDGYLEIRRGDVSARVNGNTSPIDDLVAHCLVRTKPLVYRLLAKERLPIPRYHLFTRQDMSGAVAFLDSCRGPCVVKPASGTGGGLGVTTGVRSRWQLARAAWAAGGHSSEVLIEEQLEGDNYRLLYLDGKLLDAVMRHPPSVVADGTSSVAALVQQVNQARLRQGFEASHVLLRVDMDMRNSLARQGLNLTSVPKGGTVVTLKTAINENGSSDNVSATGLVCEEIVGAGARAAAIAGVRLAGVDVITRDPGKPLEQTGGVVLEVNSPPGYYWHYQKRDGSFPVALHVLECLLEAQPLADLENGTVPHVALAQVGGV